MRMENFKTLWVLEEHKFNNYRNEGKINIAKKHNLGYAPFREWFHNDIYHTLMKDYKEYKIIEKNISRMNFNPTYLTKLL